MIDCRNGYREADTAIYSLGNRLSTRESRELPPVDIFPRGYRKSYCVAVDSHLRVIRLDIIISSDTGNI